jgi:hypothetical protein
MRFKYEISREELLKEDFPEGNDETQYMYLLVVPDKKKSLYKEFHFFGVKRSGKIEKFGRGNNYAANSYDKDWEEKITVRVHTDMNADGIIKVWFSGMDMTVRVRYGRGLEIYPVGGLK